MPGRRWSDGLHQAVEAKEKVKIERENQTLATITFQNYFRMYKKLSGMTGTAETEAPEFDKIYKLEVLAIPTNRPLIRVENPDVVYRTEAEKFEAVLDEIQEHHASGPPGARGHHLDREVGAPLDAPEEGRDQARGAQREVPRARGGDRRPGRAVRRRDHRHQHGGPGNRHHPGRRPRPPRSGDPHREGAHPGTRRRTVQRNEATEAAFSEMAVRLQAGRSPSRSRRSWTGRRWPRRYVGLLAAFAEDHPSILSVREIAGESPDLAAYLEQAAGPAAQGQGAVARTFYPQGEKPVDFLAAHPLKAALDQVATSTTLPKVEVLLDRNERERVVALGGLHILATERHEARRIDNQLRGRAGRQGDPGSSRFYLSLEDDLMRIFGSDRISGLMLHARDGGGRPHRARHGDQVHRAGPEAGGGAELRGPQAPPRVRRRDEQAAHGRLRHAPHDPRGEGHPRARPGACAREVAGLVPRLLLQRPYGRRASGTCDGLQTSLRDTFGLDAPLADLQTHGANGDGRAPRSGGF